MRYLEISEHSEFDEQIRLCLDNICARNQGPLPDVIQAIEVALRGLVHDAIIYDILNSPTSSGKAVFHDYTYFHMAESGPRDRIVSALVGSQAPETAMNEEKQIKTPPADPLMAGDFLQVVTTTESKEEAERIAVAVVEQRLAACVQVVGPMTSTYWWQGKVETAEEWLCLIKSRRAVFAELERVILNLHTYDVPEIIALPIAAVSRDYGAWLAATLKS